MILNGGVGEFINKVSLIKMVLASLNIPVVKLGKYK